MVLGVWGLPMCHMIILSVHYGVILGDSRKGMVARGLCVWKLWRFHTILVTGNWLGVIAPRFCPSLPPCSASVITNYYYIMKLILPLNLISLYCCTYYSY
jgi:hypothetical protein